MAKEKKFTETPIPLCGEEYYFDRCTMNDLKKFDEQIQDKVDELEPIQKESEALIEEEKLLQKRIDNYQKKIDLIERKDDPSDEELTKAMEYVDSQDDLLEKLSGVRDLISKHDKDNESVYRGIQDDINNIMANKVEVMLKGITAEEFLEKCDAVDMKIATYLSKYYEMCILGEKESKIRLAIKNDVFEQNKRIESFRR